MAEKKTTKKTTEKEVKVEKKFCTNCGKELKEGETCSCKIENKSEGITINTDKIVTSLNNALQTIVNTFKKPATTIEKELEEKENGTSIVLIIALTISFALFLMAIISSTIKGALNAANNLTYGLTGSVSIDVPYFKVFIYGILIYALMAVIPMLSALIISKVTKSSLTFKKAFKLYTVSNCPLIFCYLGMAIILLINVNLLTVLGYIAFAIMGIACFFNFILRCNKEITVKEDKRSYMLTSIIVIWVVIETIALVIIMGSGLSDIINSSNPNYNYNNNSSFKW